MQNRRGERRGDKDVSGSNYTLSVGNFCTCSSGLRNFVSLHLVSQVINELKKENSDILKNGNLNPSVHGSSEAFQFLVIRLWMMRRAAHTADAQRTNTRFSGEPNLVYKNPLATPQPMTPSQVKKIFILYRFC